MYVVNCIENGVYVKVTIVSNYFFSKYYYSKING